MNLLILMFLVGLAAAQCSQPTDYDLLSDMMRIAWEDWKATLPVDIVQPRFDTHPLLKVLDDAQIDLQRSIGEALESSARLYAESTAVRTHLAMQQAQLAEEMHKFRSQLPDPPPSDPDSIPAWLDPPDPPSTQLIGLILTVISNLTIPIAFVAYLRWGPKSFWTRKERVNRLPPATGSGPCRICWTEGKGLVSPCACAGDQLYIHRKCLKIWMKKSGNWASCPTCNTSYKQ